MLYITVIFAFSNVLLNKSDCFRTVKLHIVQLIVRVFHLTPITDLILYNFSSLYYWSNSTEYFFLQILSSFARPQVRSLILKLRLLPRKTSIFKHFFIDRQCFLYRLPNIVITWVKLFGPPFSMQITQFCGYLRKFLGNLSNPHPPS